MLNIVVDIVKDMVIVVMVILVVSCLDWLENDDFVMLVSIFVNGCMMV